MKRERHIARLIAATGCIMLDLQLAGSGHYRARVQFEDKPPRVFFFSKSPSDHRGDLNKQAAIRRYTREA